MENQDPKPTTSQAHNSDTISNSSLSWSDKSDSSTQTCLQIKDRPPEIRGEDVTSSLISLRSNNLYLYQISETNEAEEGPAPVAVPAPRPVQESECKSKCGRCFRVDQHSRKHKKPSLSSLPKYDFDDARPGFDINQDVSNTSLPSYHTFNESQSIKLFKVQSSSAHMQPNKDEIQNAAIELVDEITQVEAHGVVTEILMTLSESKCSNKDCEREVQVINSQTENVLPIRCTRCAPSTSRPQDRVYTSSPVLGTHSNNYFVYNIAEGSTLQYTPRLTQSLTRTLPSYSAVLRLGPSAVTKPPKCIPKPFGNLKPKQPPPSYAEAEGMYEPQSSLISGDSLFFGAEPVYIVCPNCTIVVRTETHLERSAASHVTAALLCLCCCWPCCLLPYCMKACYNIVHTCPICQYCFGVYRPW